MRNLRSPLRSVSLTGFFLLGSACASVAQDESPRLMVALVVDQLPAYLLDRYEPHYSAGLRRILDTGFRFTDAVHDHAVTETAAGHATISTGVTPSRHAIVSNTWYEFPEGEAVNVYAVQDSLSGIVGLPTQRGRSPRNLQRSGMADWVRAEDSGAQVVSVSKKDRAAITMAGQAPGHVYWLDARFGRYVTSMWYREEYPGWVDAFNRNLGDRFFADSVWTSTIPEGLTPAAPRGDTAAYESDGINTAFPHEFVLEGQGPTATDFNFWISELPFVDQATLGLAETAMRRLELGRDDVVDYLSLALSQTDYVGHAYGPYSVEQLDNMLRLDRAIGEFLDFLDDYVGEGRWVLAMTSDHGVSPIPEYLREIGEPGLRMGRDELTSAVSTGRLAVLTSQGQEAAAVAWNAAEALEELEFIADAITEDELAGPPSDDEFIRLYQNTYFPGRRPSILHQYGVPVEVRYTPGTVLYPGGGTTHGSPYRYDRHVPLVFVGAGVPMGASDDPVRTVDVAPTLSALAGITFPEDLDGRYILP